MKLVTPRAFIIGETRVNETGMRGFLEALGADQYAAKSHSIPDGQLIAEVAGRTCYRSFQVGLNPNVNSVRSDSAAYMANVIESAHGSVLEHATLNFGLVNISRVLTHELVRHRHGVAISQESLRFVRLTDLGVYYPGSFGVDTIDALFDSIPREELLAPGEVMYDLDGKAVWYRPCADGTGQFGPAAFCEVTPDEMRSFWVAERVAALLEIFEAEIRADEDAQNAMSNMLRLDMSKSFKVKKLITSGMRRMAPMGLATAMVWSVNHRQLRFVIQQRTGVGSEEEIRLLFQNIYREVSRRYPDIYFDGQLVPDEGVERAMGTRNYSVQFANHKI